MMTLPLNTIDREGEGRIHSSRNREGSPSLSGVLRVAALGSVLILRSFN
jgi:hypothetical protein